jgi:ubiquinone/menaquinone biosynthesis C-methylase UbiE
MDREETDVSSEIDFDKQAAVFDQFLPLLASVADHLAEQTTGLPSGARVLDIACGTGEPGLTLLARRPDLHLLGIDSSDAMIGVARHKAAGRNLTGARFEVMNSQNLTIEDGTIDAVVSRFGILSFADPLAEARELARVLRPGGTFHIATWDAVSMNTLSFAIMTAAWDQLPSPVQAVLRGQEPLTMLGRREACLGSAGLTDLSSALFSWQVDFPDEQSLWDLVSGPASLGAFVAAIDEETLTGIRRRFDDMLSHYRRADDSYRLPYACRFISGHQGSGT